MSKPLRILILEDRAVDADLVTRELRKAGFEFVAKTVATEKEFLAELRDSAPDLILADYSLPSYDGLSALAAAQKQCPETPFIVVSGTLGEERAIDTLQRGATDYVLKDRLARLGPAVRRALRERDEMQKRNQAEHEARENEKQLRAMFDLASVGMAQADPQTGQWLRVNQRMSAITGYSAAELLRLRISEITHPDDRQKDCDEFRRVVRGEAPDYRLEKRYVRKDGTVAWVNVNMTVILDAAGQPRRTMATIEDITERKRAESTLWQREEYFRALTERASDVITVLNADAAIRYQSPSTEQVFGYKPGELVGWNVLELVHPEDRPRAQQALTESIKTPGSVARIELRFRHKDGSWRVLEATSRNLLDDPNVKGIVVNSRDMTERKQLEEALRESSQFNQQIVNSAQEGIVVYGLDLKCQVWNPYMEQLTGMRADQVLGKRPDELFPFLRETGLLASIEKVLAGEPASSIEIHVPGLLAGNSDWTSQTNGPLRNSSGEIIGVIGIVRDMTERKRAELRIAAFANLGQRLNSAKTAREAGEIIVAVADALLGWDACLFDLYSAAKNRVSHVLNMDLVDGRRTECKQQYQETTPRMLSKRTIEQGGQLILRDHPEAMRPEGPRFGDMSRPSASLMFVPIRHGTEIVGVLSIQSYTPRAYDAYSLETLQALADYGGGALTRIQAEASRARLAELMQLLLQSTDEGVYGVDLAGRCTFMNRAGAEMIGRPAEEIEGHDPHQIFHHHRADGAPYPADECPVFRAFRTGERYHVDNEVFWRQNGTSFPIEYSARPIIEAGVIAGAVVTFTDISRRLLLEHQLRQSQKMEAVGQLAGGVAHDFNNMLAVIRGNAELLLMDEGRHSADTREGLKHVVEASERAANLTRQLLAFSRKQVLQPQPLLLNEVIANLTKMLHRVLRENIDLQCKYAAPLAYVLADTGMIEQVILNLVVNARDAMPAGGQLRVATGQLTLDEEHARVNPEARVGDFVCLLVSDTGTGIAPEVLPRIFEPFFTTKELGKGTGLGLATVYGIVKQHEGWIEVSSQLGVGSTFTVFLPAVATPARLAAAAAAGAEVLGGKETILLVEDEHAVRLTTRRVLESKGYTVREATSAREALELWQSHAGEIALLLTDIIMPGEMTGRDLAEKLWTQSPRLKVVFMSGYSAEVLGKGTDFIRRTRTYFLQKPSTSRAILETVRRCLDQKESGGAPAKPSPAE